MLKFVEIEASKEAFLVALFGLEIAEKDILSLRSLNVPCSKIQELEAKAKTLKKKLKENAAHATPRAINYGISPVK